jgi:hypothetical protein
VLELSHGNEEVKHEVLKKTTEACGRNGMKTGIEERERKGK